MPPNGQDGSVRPLSVPERASYPPTNERLLINGAEPPVLPWPRGGKCCLNADLHDARDNVSLLGKERLDPINYSADAGGAAQITVDNDPVFGSDFWDRWGQSFKQRMAVSHITGSTPRPVPARIASKCISIDDARSVTGLPVSSTCRWTQRAGA